MLDPSRGRITIGAIGASSGGGVSDVICENSSSTVVAVDGGLPAISSYASTPTENTSLRSSGGSPAICSGAM